MYKILYLPLAEEILIYKKGNRKFIKSDNPLGTRAPGLRCPRSVEQDPDQWETATSVVGLNRSTFIVAYFSNKEIAKKYISELLSRGACNKYNLRLEYFEIVRV